MKTKKQISIILSILLALSTQALSQDTEVEIEIFELSDRVIVLNPVLADNPFTGNGNIIAIATVKGLIVVDTSKDVKTMAKMRKKIESFFSRDDFIYVINTHEHLEHLGGNAVFPNCTIIAHDNLKKGVEETLPRYKEYFRNMIPNLEDQLKNMDEDSDEAAQLKKSIKEMKENQASLENEFELVVPTVTFSDRLTLDCGNLTINLIYYGCGHSNSDILVHIPQEGVLAIGSACNLDIPPLINPNLKNDYERWNVVLTELLNDENKVDYIVSSHLDFGYMTREDLVFIRHYRNELWLGIREAKTKGLSLEAVKRQYSLEKKFSRFPQFKEVGSSEKYKEFREYFQLMKNRGFTQCKDVEEQIRVTHNGNIDNVWNSLKK